MSRPYFQNCRSPDWQECVPVDRATGYHVRSGLPNKPIWPQPQGFPTPPGGPGDTPGYKDPIKCNGLDTCAQLNGKIDSLLNAIKAHRNWDKRYYPGRHAQEIKELENGLQNCRKMWGDNCRKKKKRCRKQQQPLIPPFIVRPPAAAGGAGGAAALKPAAGLCLPAVFPWWIFEPFDPAHPPST